MKTLIACVALSMSLSAVAVTKKPANQPKTFTAPNLTKEQMEFVKKARQSFKEADKAPAPSVHMQDKMQSSVKQ